MTKCAGQDSRFWDFNSVFEIKCPQCGYKMEFFKDDTSRTCRQCGSHILNPKMDFGCASYCKFAEQCLGTLPPELLAKRDDLLKDRIAIEIKRYLKNDFKRIGHITRVARYAEQIGKKEKGDLGIILAAAYLHDIDIQERGTLSSTEKALEILERLGAKKELIHEVCKDIKGLCHPEGLEDINFRVLYDAYQIALLDEKLKRSEVTQDEINEFIKKTLLTESGREIVKKGLMP